MAGGVRGGRGLWLRSRQQRQQLPGCGAGRAAERGARISRRVEPLSIPESASAAKAGLTDTLACRTSFPVAPGGLDAVAQLRPGGASWNRCAATGRAHAPLRTSLCREEASSWARACVQSRERE
jgi:hypothetical protein